MCRGSDFQGVAEDGKDTVERNDGCNSRHDCLGRGLAHRGGVRTALHTAQTAGVGHQETKEAALANPKEKAFELNHVKGTREVDRGGDVERADRYEKATGDADQVGKNAEKG